MAGCGDSIHQILDDRSAKKSGPAKEDIQVEGQDSAADGRWSKKPRESKEDAKTREALADSTREGKHDARQAVGRSGRLCGLAERRRLRIGMFLERLGVAIACAAEYLLRYGHELRSTPYLVNDWIDVLRVQD